MSSASSKDGEAHEMQQREREEEKGEKLQKENEHGHEHKQEHEEQIQGIETEEENKVLVTTKETIQEVSKETKEAETGVSDEKEKAKTPAKDEPSAAKKTPSQASKSATKRKFGSLHTRNSAAESSHIECQKTKKARASELMKTSATKTNAGIKTREFSFARPTESSARRSAAVAENQTQMKATPLSRKLQRVKSTPAKDQHASTSALKTPTVTAGDKACRPHFSYSPYTGPLPPLTVESSFAPKNGQVSDRAVWSAPPSRSKMAAGTRKPRPASSKKPQPQSTTGKENNGVSTEEDAATKAASSSRTPVESSKTRSSVTTKVNRSVFKEKVTDQGSLAQEAGRLSPVSMPATIEGEPTA